MPCKVYITPGQDMSCEMAGEFTTAAGYRGTVVPNSDGRVALRYYDSIGNEAYRSWKLSPGILHALVCFWDAYRSGDFFVPASERFSAGEIRMVSDKTVSLREAIPADPYGRLMMFGAELSVDLVEALYRMTPKRVSEENST